MKPWVNFPKTVPVFLLIIVAICDGVIYRAPHRSFGSDILINDRNQSQVGQFIRLAEGSVFGSADTTVGALKVPYYAYKGIPFAVPPLGELRFKDPVPYPNWQGTRLATQFKDYCLGFLFSFMSGDEDCLYLNVFAPKRNPEDQRLLPVIFWIHGGGFQHGSDINSWLYYPGRFLEQGIIFVSPNYRLGALGFLSTDDAVAPGNYGLKDIALALRWTRMNARAFGGDPDAITVMGQSAGAVTAHLLAFSPVTQGLFRSGISMSGAATVNWGIHPRHRLVANKMASSLNCPVRSSEEMIFCLRRRGARELASGVKEFYTLPGPRYAIPFAPRIDADSSYPILPQHPLKMILNRRFQPKPWIFGYTKDEAASFYWGIYYDEDRIMKLDSIWDMQCKRHIFASLGAEDVLPPPNQMLGVCKRARKLYFGGKRINNNSSTELTQVGTDALIAFGTIAAAMIQCQRSVDTWLYRWDHANDKISFVNVVNYIFNNRLHGFITKTKRTSDFRLGPSVGHLDDLFLLMSPPVFPPLKGGDLAVQDLMSETFGSFIKFGNPTVGNNVNWPQFNRYSQKYLIVEEKPRVEDHPMSEEKMTLWAQTYDLFNQEHLHFAIPSLNNLLDLPPVEKSGEFQDTRPSAMLRISNIDVAPEAQYHAYPPFQLFPLNIWASPHYFRPIPASSTASMSQRFGSNGAAILGSLDSWNSLRNFPPAMVYPQPMHNWQRFLYRNPPGMNHNWMLPPYWSIFNMAAPNRVFMSPVFQPVASLPVGNNKHDMPFEGKNIVFIKPSFSNPAGNALTPQPPSIFPAFIASRPSAIENTGRTEMPEPEEPTSPSNNNSSPFCGYQNTDLTCGLDQTVCLREYPWLVLLYSSGDSITCSGALISPNYVLASSFCVKSLTKIRVGENDLSTEKDCTRGRLKSCWQHVDFKPITVNQNGPISLIRLDKTVPEELATPICIPGNEEANKLATGVVILAGWGLHQAGADKTIGTPNGRQIRNQAKTAALDPCLISKKNSTFCAEDKLNSENECISDNGSPLMSPISGSGQFFLMGLKAETDDKVCFSGNPVEFIRVSDYHDWIKAQTFDNS
ncbi:unnamed protein product [Notodromas monacha]|uniref:Peptidase S1 domain-containing protein n=1 Tax=Notodromas monacha TaxID=399045 RepID=A0A7R9BYP9_9CRUS|nr:unnamed protein product [Notodromas monacha]CAG0922728.1 unnamed protein product [Notodromas monacha]